MSTTDPLREALQGLLRVIDGKVSASDAATDVRFAREAIAAVPVERNANSTERDAQRTERAVPVEPEHDDDRDQIGVCEHCDHVVARGGERIQTRHAVACSHLHIRAYVPARPVEPEAWEWRAVHSSGSPTLNIFATREALECHMVTWERNGWRGYMECRPAPGPWERVDPEPRHLPPREFWRDVLPCGHPPDPVAWFNGSGHVCHCGNGLDEAKGIAIDAAPGPVVLCQQCGCNVACPEPRLQDGGE